MAKWGEIKCPRREEHAALVEKAKKVQSSYWKEDGTLFTDQTVVPGLLKRLEELEAKLAKALRALERIELSTDTREQGAIAMATLAALKGQGDE